MDWIDRVKAERDNGVNRPLLPSQHEAVNTRYPGCTLEYCCQCEQATGRAGRGDDSLFDNNGDGPFCSDCWSAKEE